MLLPVALLSVLQVASADSWSATRKLTGDVVAAAAQQTAFSDSATCEAKSSGAPLFITAACVDPVLNKPYVDIKRPGTITDPKTRVTVTFIYVHGGFTGTNAKFAFYFPAADKYKGRFFETTYPTLGQEDAAEGCTAVGTSACSVVFALSSGAYVVSTNNAGGVPAGGPLAAYRTNAAAAKYSRVIAKETYGGSARPRGYLYGASGGGYQTVGAMENTSGVWDGAVPMVFGAPNAIPSFMTGQLLALRLLGDKLPRIADAMAPGGSGDPYAGLNSDERSALDEVTRLGMPLRGWWQHATLNGGGFWAIAGVVRALDRSYSDDFWTTPGYEGSEPAVQAARIRDDVQVTALAGTKGLVLSHIPPGNFLNADIVLTAGPKAGQSFQIMKVNGDTVEVSANAEVTSGTTVRLDNSWLIALQYYQRHQSAGDSEYGFKQYRNADGAPRYALRPKTLGPMLNASSAGSQASGTFHGKMIMVESAMDVSAFPWSADWYRQQAKGDQGSKLDDNFRLWYMENADHGPDLSAYETGVGFEQLRGAIEHIVGYLGEVEQALLDLDAWVVKGAAPPATTGYRIDDHNQVQLAATAIDRHGVQPVVSLNAKGSAGTSPGQTVEVAAGEPVSFFVNAMTPAGAGEIVKVEWDFESRGKFEAHATTLRPGRAVKVSATHIFAQPGTYFSVVRVTSQRDGDTRSPFGLVQNLAAVRVVIH